jgi:hypothetical protein
MRILPAVAVLLLVGACGDSTGPKENQVGVFQLRLVGAQPLPAVYIDKSDLKIEIIAGSVRIESDGTYEAWGTKRETKAGQVSIATSSYGGTYSIKGTKVTFPPEDGWFTTGSLRGDTLTVSPAGWPTLLDHMYPYTYIKP